MVYLQKNLWFKIIFVQNIISSEKKNKFKNIQREKNKGNTSIISFHILPDKSMNTIIIKMKIFILNFW